MVLDNLPGIGGSVCFFGLDGRPRPAIVQDTSMDGVLCLLVLPAAGETMYASTASGMTAQIPYQQEWAVRHRDDPHREPHRSWWISADEARPSNAR